MEWEEKKKKTVDEDTSTLAFIHFSLAVKPQVSSLTSGVSFAMEVKSIDTICQEENYTFNIRKTICAANICLSADQKKAEVAKCYL